MILAGNTEVDVLDLIIVDGDCRNLWPLPELQQLLDASHDVVWLCEDAVLREHGYNAAAAAQAAIGAAFGKAILVTRLQNGVMSYHRQMLRSTVRCGRWLIAIVGETSNAYKEQYCNEINSLLGGIIRYEVIFDNSAEMKLILEAKREVVDERPFCIIATQSDAQLAENVRKTLEATYIDWRFECHVGLKEDSYRFSDIILVIGRSGEDCAVPPAMENASRVRIWLESLRGRITEKPEMRIVDLMNRHGWNLGNRRIWSSCLVNEKLLQELNSGEISKEALCADDRFVMWDRYGLPLPACSYESADKAEAFLRRQCCFPSLLESENEKGELWDAI